MMRGSESARRYLAVLGPWLGLIAVWTLFALAVGRPFWAWENQRLMLQQTAIVGTAAVGATFVIVSGGIDLAVGSTIALLTVVLAKLVNTGWPDALALAGVVAAGAVIGTGVGTLVTGRVERVLAALLGGAAAYWAFDALGPAGAALLGLGTAIGLALLLARALPRLPLSPFIVTLALWGALRGVAKGLARNQPVYVDRPVGTEGYSVPFVELMLPARSGPAAVMPWGVWLLLGLALLAAATLRFTRFGRHVFAIGSNEQTARLCGVRVERTKLRVYALASACAGLAAVLQFADLGGMGDPTTAEGLELKVIAAVVIGGASLTGGEGSIAGTLIGALIMTVVGNGCTQLGFENQVQEIVTGAIILAAVILDRLRHARST